MPHSTPLIVITRPQPQADRFADAVRDAYASLVDILVAPVMRIDVLPAQVDPSHNVILSSANAVAALGQAGQGRVAYCVGGRTAAAAKEAGFATRVANGSAGSLIDLVRKGEHKAPLVHVRGEHSRGNIAETLLCAGVDVREQIVYRQAEVALEKNAILRISRAERVLFPIFSPRTAAILSQQLSKIDLNPAVVALSDEIASEVRFAKEIDVAPSISAETMIKCLERHIAA